MKKPKGKVNSLDSLQVVCGISKALLCFLLLTLLFSLLLPSSYLHCQNYRASLLRRHLRRRFEAKKFYEWKFHLVLWKLYEAKAKAGGTNIFQSAKVKCR